MSTAKAEVRELLGKLPNDCSLEDIQYHLYVLEKVRNGLEAADAEGTVPQNEAEARLSKWLTE
jgi:predicted transcriptional regulator